MNRRTLVDTAMGRQPADLLLKNVRLANVLSGDIHETCVSVKDGYVCGFEEVDAEQILDGQGRYLCPGLIDGHIHIESSMLIPSRFAQAAAPHGTAAVVCDPHEIANVLGMEGVEWMIHNARNRPVSFYFMAPSCVPATHMETAGAHITQADISTLFEKYPDEVVGLAEMMNYPGVIFGDEGVFAKLDAAGGRTLDGHAPLLVGRELSAYIAAGPGSDHETIGLEEAREKLRKGVFLMLREGSQEHNLADLIAVVNEYNAQNCCLVSDDRQAGDLLRDGHMDAVVRKAVSLGMPPIRALQCASINTARRFGLRGRGAVAPGYRADFFLCDDLDDIMPQDVHFSGKPLAASASQAKDAVELPRSSMQVRPLGNDAFRIPAGGKDIRVIGALPGQIVTEHRRLPAHIVDGYAEADPARDIAKLAVIERHGATGNIGLGFVQGLHLPCGAIASSVAHDSHNIIVAGMNDADMLTAARVLVESGGGFTVVDAEVRASLALPVAGLMSHGPAAEVVADIEGVQAALQSMHVQHPNPFAVLAFLALPVIPSLKLTDKGLVDVEQFDFVDLFHK